MATDASAADDKSTVAEREKGFINPDSMKVIAAKLEPMLATVEPGTIARRTKPALFS